MMSGAPAHGGDVAPATSRPTHADAWPGQRTGTRDTALTDSPFGGDGGRDPLQPVDGVQLYTRRWYVLAVFTAMAFMQSMNWATWSPIATVAKQYYHWSDDTIGEWRVARAQDASRGATPRHVRLQRYLLPVADPNCPRQPCLRTGARSCSFRSRSRPGT